MGYVLFPGESLNQEFYPWKDLQQQVNNLPLTSHRFFGSDPMTAHFPWKFIGIEMLKKGEWPLWNPYSFAGSPLLANGQSSLFYPLNFIYFILDFVSAWNIMTITQIILSGLFFFFLLREYKLSRPAALWGAMIYDWNGYLANYLHIHVIGQSWVWLPLALLSIMKLRARNNLIFFLFLIFSLTAILLAGYLQTSGYCLLVIILFTLISYRSVFKKLMISLLLSFSLSAPQLLPTMEFLSKSERTASLFYDYFSFLASPTQLIRLLMPRFFGHPNLENWWGGSLQRDHSYVGVLGIIFAFVGIYFIFKLKKFYFWVFLICFLLLATLESPLSKFFYNLPIPFLNSVTPSRGLGFIVLPLSFFSALGFEKLVLGKQKVWKIIVGISFFSFAAGLFYYIYAINTFASSINILNTARQSFIQLTVLVFFFIFLMFIYMRKFLPVYMILILLFLVQTGDLLRENKFFTRTFIKRELLYPDTSLTDFLRRQDARFLSLDLWLLIPNSFLPYHLYTLTSYDALHLKISYRFMEAIFQNIPQKYPLDPRSIRFSDINKQLANMLNIRFLLSLTPLSKTSLSVMGKIDSVYVYENKEVQPFGFLISKFIVMDEKEQLQKMLNKDTNFADTVFLLEEPTEGVDVTTGGYAQLLRRGGSFSEWLVSTPKPQILFIPETYDSGWGAFIDGQKTKIYQANFAFQAVVVPSGNHTVRTVYNPLSFRIGVAIFLITFLSLFFISLKRMISLEENRHN